MNNERKFYVYGYLRLDTNTYFYIGKGCGKRWKDIHDRNPHFKNIVNARECVVEILADNLTEKEAFELERKFIEDLVFEEGYSIGIKGFCERDENNHLCNQSFGGEGSSGYKHSQESKDKMSEARSGEKNHFYGKTHSDETKQKISEIRKEKGLAKGENNPMFGLKGDKSPIKGRTHSEEELTKMSLGNPNRKGVRCITLDLSFRSLTHAENYIKENYDIKFSRKVLVNILNNNEHYYGEIIINNEKTQLYWEFE